MIVLIWLKRSEKWRQRDGKKVRGLMGEKESRRVGQFQRERERLTEKGRDRERPTDRQTDRQTD